MVMESRFVTACLERVGKAVLIKVCVLSLNILLIKLVTDSYIKSIVGRFTPGFWLGATG